VDPPSGPTQVTATPITVELGTGQTARIDLLGHLQAATLDPATLVIVTPPRHGVAIVLPGGVVEYTAQPGFHFEVSFGYRICSADGLLCVTGTVVVDLELVPGVPGETGADARRSG
jgi:hypothetical protein